jgi:hypothetical protein
MNSKLQELTRLMILSNLVLGTIGNIIFSDWQQQENISSQCIKFLLFFTISQIILVLTEKK